MTNVPLDVDSSSASSGLTPDQPRHRRSPFRILTTSLVTLLLAVPLTVGGTAVAGPAVAASTAPVAASTAPVAASSPAVVSQAVAATKPRVKAKRKKRWVKKGKPVTPPPAPKPAPQPKPPAPAPTPPAPAPTTSVPPQTPATAGRLTRSGNRLLLNGATYRYVGVNAYGLNGQETGYPYSAAELDALFSSLPKQTLTRTWAWKSNGSASLDAVVKAAERHGQLLILSLSEGAGWDSPRVTRSEAWFARGYTSDLLPWVDEVVSKYRNSPAVGMWEIMNEPGNRGGTSGPVATTTMKSFFDTVAARIKANDPNHLVETGTMDAKQYGTSDWVALNSGPNIDVQSIHDYADEYEGGALVSWNYLMIESQIKAVGKPVIIGEMGVRGADPGTGCVRDRTARASIYKQKFDAYFAKGVSGINIWNWFPRKSNDCYAGQSLYSGDPTMGLLRTYRPS